MMRVQSNQQDASEELQAALEAAKQAETVQKEAEQKASELKVMFL